MAFPLSTKRVLIINPLDTGDFAAELINKLSKKNTNVYVWVWSVNDVMRALEQLPDSFIPIMIDFNNKTSEREYLRLVPPVDFILKFSKEKMSSQFASTFSFLMKKRFKNIQIEEVPRNSDKIVRKLEKVDGGLMINIRPESAITAIMTQPFKSLKAGSSKKSKSREEPDIEKSPLLDDPPGASISIERQNNSVGIVFRCFGCCSSLADGDSNERDADAHLRARLRRLHLDAKRKWQSMPNSVADERKHYANLVDKQLEILNEVSFVA